MTGEIPTKKFEFIDHTADLGIRGFGLTFLEALENVARGMFSKICDLEKVDTKVSLPIRVQDVSLEDVVVRFLNQLIYFYDAEGFLCKDYALTQEGEVLITGKVLGEYIDREKHILYSEIKAATYHHLKVQQNKYWIVQVIFDM